tara:strand:- start:27 stop:1013 length:987 start_codon:yes stop_codon:yes gene_type:complete
MPNIFLQPSSTNATLKNSDDAILKEFSIDKYKDLMDQKDYEVLKGIYPDGIAKLRGITPGKNDSNVNKWKSIEPGDVVLFYRKGVYELSAVTTYTLRNQDLGLALWGIDNKQQTWEYMYFLAEVKNIHLPKEELNRLVGYSENNFPQGFIRISRCTEEARLKILDELDLLSNVYYPEVDADSLDKLSNFLDANEELDKEILSKRRVEQGILRRVLFNQQPTFTCCICQREYLTNFMVAAHIKKRSECNREERLDIENIAVPMCKFGCDDLYEHGYISVDKGTVTILNNNVTRPMLEYMKEIKGNACSYWKPKTAQYFQWHLDINKREE